MDGKYNSQKLYFKKPNVLIVFANDEPKRAKLSKDRWVILKISNDLTELVDIVGGYLSKNNGKRVCQKMFKTRIFTDDSRVGRNDLRYIIHHQNEPTKQKLWQVLLDGRTDGQTILDIL